MTQNILDYKASSIDPALLVSKQHNAATGMCTDDTLTAMPKSKVSEEVKLAERFLCRDIETPPFEFKGLNVLYSPSTSSACLF